MCTKYVLIRRIEVIHIAKENITKPYASDEIVMSGRKSQRRKITVNKVKL